ncbi:armadillo repeat protein [Echinococcus multilocularis]|uniref:Armadillo repeat protein n=1 Tax=Echinococcus multilocularis TaxID=6211 RepID=A0A068YMM8_ECHMU|nr:armadillo repeat protein [Echinococcus multilocularis]
MQDLVGSFKAIALDNSRCQSLLTDATSLSGLVILLSSECPSVVLGILETFIALSKRENGLIYISRLHGLRDQLLGLQEEDENIPPEVMGLAHSLYEELYSTKHCLKRSGTKVSRLKCQRKSHSIVVQLSGKINMSGLKVIESQLLTIKGVISITFQLNKCRVIVMTVDTIEPEQILDKVRVACQQLASESGLTDIPACFIRRRKSTCSQVALQRRDAVRSSYASISSTMPPPGQLKTRQKPQPMKPYLMDGADIFEVDPDRGVPQCRNVIANDASGTSRGFGGWLSDLLERTVFW